MIHWIKVCIGLVEFAYTVPFQVLEPFLRAYFNDRNEDFSIAQVVKAIGLPSQSLFYSMNLPEEEHNQEQQEEVNETPTSGRNGPTNVELVDTEALMRSVIKNIDNRQPVPTPTTLEAGFEDVPL